MRKGKSVEGHAEVVNLSEQMKSAGIVTFQVESRKEIGLLG
jgi:hypothetical protein